MAGLRAETFIRNKSRQFYTHACIYISALFPLVLYNWRKNNPKLKTSMLLTIQQAKVIAKVIANDDFGNHMFMEYTNWMYNTLTQTGYDKEYLTKIYMKKNFINHS